MAEVLAPTRRFEIEARLLPTASAGTKDCTPQVLPRPIGFAGCESRTVKVEGRLQPQGCRG